MKREFVKINYKIHTDSIKENLIPPEITKKEADRIYASETDLLNKALFGLTAKEWIEINKNKKGNIRDDASIIQLIILANLETLNSEFIREKQPSDKRLIRLNKIAIRQMKSLINDKKFILT